jgi:hypothetical protein
MSSGIVCRCNKVNSTFMDPHKYDDVGVKVCRNCCEFKLNIFFTWNYVKCLCYCLCKLNTVVSSFHTVKLSSVTNILLVNVSCQTGI